MRVLAESVEVAILDRRWPEKE